MAFNIFYTTPEPAYFILRIAVGIIILPYGLQKFSVWFPPLGGGVGFRETTANFKKKKLHAFFAWLVIIAQVFGSIGLILGCLDGVAALEILSFF